MINIFLNKIVNIYICCFLPAADYNLFIFYICAK